MFNKKQIESHIFDMDLSEVIRPSDELIAEVLSHGKTRILSNSKDELDSFTKQFFEFCWTQVGRFGFRSLNAIEIGYLTHISPFYIACAIHTHGVDWALKLLQMKRIAVLDRGEFSIVRASTSYFSVRDLLNNAESGVCGIRKEIRDFIHAGDIEGLRNLLADNAASICHVFNDKPVFRTPSEEDRIAEKKPKRNRTPKGEYRPRFDGVDAKI